MEAVQTFTLKDGQTLVIRQAMPKDAERVVNHFKTVADESENLPFGSDEFIKTVEEEEKHIQDQLGADNDLYLVAEVEGELVSVLNFSVGKRKRKAHVGEFGITVLKKYWGLGVGKRVLEYLIQWAQESPKVRKINLLVRTDNEPAIKLYEKLGFQIEGKWSRDMLIDGVFYDAYCMGLWIDDKPGI